MDSRMAIGVSMHADAGEIHAVLMIVNGYGLDGRVQCVAASTAPTFRIVPASNWANAANRPDPPGAVAAHLDPCVVADQVMDAVNGVVDRSGIPLDQVMFVSLLASDWLEHPYESLVAARLAELSGITVLAGFSVRDWAAGGRGRPIGALVDWMLANDQRFSRVIVHVDENTRLTVLPAAAGPSRVQSFEAGPGMALIDSLAAAFAQGRTAVDSRGMLAVQGRQIKPLVRRWATHPFLRQAPPKALSPLDFSHSFVQETIQLAVERGWSVADVLCTATHFLAACPADATRQFVLKDQRLEQVIVVGRGTQNGFLLRLLEDQFREVGIVTATVPEITRDAYEAVTAALLGALTLDGVPSNLPGVTGAAGVRLLGHVIPGTVRNWQRCLEWMQRSIKLVAPRAA